MLRRNLRQLDAFALRLRRVLREGEIDVRTGDDVVELLMAARKVAHAVPRRIEDCLYRRSIRFPPRTGCPAATGS